MDELCTKRSSHCVWDRLITTQPSPPTCDHLPTVRLLFKTHATCLSVCCCLTLSTSEQPRCIRSKLRQQQDGHKIFDPVMITRCLWVKIVNKPTINIQEYVKIHLAKQWKLSYWAINVFEIPALPQVLGLETFWEFFVKLWQLIAANEI